MPIHHSLGEYQAPTQKVLVWVTGRTELPLGTHLHIYHFGEDGISCQVEIDRLFNLEQQCEPAWGQMNPAYEEVRMRELHGDLPYEEVEDDDYYALDYDWWYSLVATPPEP